MKLLTNWGFTREGWRNNQRGEYWVLAQMLLILGFVLLPVYRIPIWEINLSESVYIRLGSTVIFALAAIVFFAKGLLDLGGQLTPLPYPKEEGELVKSGIYSLVRHPIYSGVILAAVSWAIFQMSFSHLFAAGVLFVFFDIKASREETWLSQKYPDYPEYREKVKKLIPGLY